MPVERVLENLAAQIESDPANADAYMNIGRAHSYVYQTSVSELVVGGWGYRVSNDQEEIAITVGNRRSQQRARVDGLELTDKERHQHLKKSVIAFSRAIELRDGFAIAHLGLADILRAGQDDAASIKALPTPAHPALVTENRTDRENELHLATNEHLAPVEYALSRIAPVDEEHLYGSVARPSRHFIELVVFARSAADGERLVLIEHAAARYWEHQVAEHYLKAFLLTYATDAHRTHQPGLTGLGSLVAYESGKGYLNAIASYGEIKADKPRITLVEAGIEAFNDLDIVHAVTPIIFSLNKPASLESLLAPETIVTFDLDGTGRDQAWPWVSPETAILVWDPEESGEITSGRQLFGSVSWWLFFDDGYRALDALDDNRDGELAGDELPGLAIWTDINSNGVSDPGEVVPIAKTGIEAISCRQTDTELGMPANYSGLRMTDGRVLPTYDWVAESVHVEEVSNR